MQTLSSKHVVIDRPQSADHILLTKRVIHKHDHFTASENVFIPTPQARHPSVSGFGLPEETFVLVIGPWHMRMIITRKQAFQNPRV
jgi:hypothetical protein